MAENADKLIEVIGRLVRSNETLTAAVNGMRNDFKPQIEEAHAVRLRQEESLKNRESSRRAKQKRLARERNREKLMKEAL